jgi:hypothetical protein
MISERSTKTESLSLQSGEIIAEFTKNRRLGNTSITLFLDHGVISESWKGSISIMKSRKTTVVALLFAFLIVAVSVVGAQDTSETQPLQRPEGPVRTLIGIVGEATGLETREILRQLGDGSTLADIITANDGDVDQVVAETVALLTDNINQGVADGSITQERADNLLATLEDVVTRAVDGELFPNRLDQSAIATAARRILIQATADATGLQSEDITRQLRDGSTLAELITANGADVNTVLNDAVAAATEQINAAVAEGRLGQVQADRLLANLPDLYNTAVNGELRQELVEWGVTRGLLALAAEHTGLQPREIAEELRYGQSLADVLTNHDVDVNTFIDAAVTQLDERLDTAVTNGRITQERADEMLQTFRDRLTEGINQVRPQTAEAPTI